MSIPPFLLCLLLYLVIGRQNYRLYTIQKIPTLKLLDYQKVKQNERDRAQRLASSAAGAAMEADARLEARAAATASSASIMNGDDTLVSASGGSYANGSTNNTFEPGEGKSAEESFVTQFTMEEKTKIRDMVTNAASAEEIDRIENLVKRGIFPGEVLSGNGSIPPPPPPPLEEEQWGDDDEIAEDGGSSKRKRIE